MHPGRGPRLRRLRCAAATACLLLAGCPQSSPGAAAPRGVGSSAAVGAGPATAPTGAFERVTLHTEDGWSIVGDYHPSITSGPAVIFAHQLGSDRGEWAPLVARLLHAGPTLATLAIDLRGHGESTNGPDGPTVWSSFGNDPSRWRSLHRDVVAAIQFVRARALPPTSVVLIGSGIGASAALLAADAEPSVTGLVLLSPGANDRGVAVLEPFRQIASSGRSLLLIATDGDTAAAQAAHALAERVAGGARVETMLYRGLDAHGVALGRARPDLWDRVARFVRTGDVAPMPTMARDTSADGGPPADAQSDLARVEPRDASVRTDALDTVARDR